MVSPSNVGLCHPSAVLLTTLIQMAKIKKSKMALIQMAKKRGLKMHPLECFFEISSGEISILGYVLQRKKGVFHRKRR